jgi:hypothetical protein
MKIPAANSGAVLKPSAHSTSVTELYILSYKSNHPRDIDDNIFYVISRSQTIVSTIGNGTISSVNVQKRWLFLAVIRDPL